MSGTRIASVSGLRGIVGNGLDPIVVTEFAAAYSSGREPGPIVVGHDARISAPVFLHTVCSAVTAAGRDVLLAEATATPTLGKLVKDLRAAGGIQISASHNPPTYNGLKFFQPGGMALAPAQGKEMLARIDRKDFAWADWKSLGRVIPILEPDAAHLESILKLVDVDKIRSRRFTVALDACHGAGGRLAESLLRELGCVPIVLGAVPDGRYDHPPEPTATNLKGFSGVVPAVGAAVGFAQDPDADRLAIIDETGRYVGEELTLALAISALPRDATGSAVINLSTSKVSEDVARAKGFQVFRVPVGEIHVVERMIAQNALIGGEGNGGVIDPRVGFVRDSFVAIAMTLDLLARSETPLSRLADALPKYAMVKDQYPRVVGSIDELFDRLAKFYPDAEFDRQDGLRLDWRNRWAHVRPSNTEPIVRVITEAEDAQTARRLADEIGRTLTVGSAS